MKTNNELNVNPNWISDEEMDSLIATSLERQDILEEINREVMGEVSRTARRETLSRWTRVAAFAFGLPFVLLCFVAGIYYIYKNVEMQPYMWIAFGLSSIAMLFFVGKEIKDFSISRV
ncbi:MAG: hypothetical protein K6C10_10400 [Prevotella sp.]|nr:hypothetical protein [Prevotella sp.]